MATPIRVLILGHRSSDVESILDELERSGYDADGHQVDTEIEFIATVELGFDLIIANYHLPGFDALRALDHMKDRRVSTPFIVVTDALGDELAAECMRRGADDYFLKERIGRLGVAVREILDRTPADLDARRQSNESGISQTTYQRILDNLFDAVAITVGTNRVFVNSSFLEIHGLDSPSQALNAPFDKYVHSDDRGLVEEWRVACQRGNSGRNEGEYRIRRGDGQMRTVRAFTVAITHQGEAAMLEVLRDVEDRKQSEAVLEQRVRELNALNVLFQDHLEQRFAVVQAFREVLSGLQKLVDDTSAVAEDPDLQPLRNIEDILGAADASPRSEHYESQS